MLETIFYIYTTKATGNSRSGIPGNMSLQKFPREFCSVLHLIFLYTIILSFDKCSYSAKHNVKVHYNFVDSIETLKKFVSRLQCP